MKPVELVITNSLYESMGKVQEATSGLPALLQHRLLSELCSISAAETVARACLCDIAHNVAIKDVLRALAIVGGPSTLDEISQRMTAIIDQQSSHASA